MTSKDDIINLAGDAHLDEAMESLLADYLRTLARRIQDANPDRTPDFTEGVEWAVEEMLAEAEK